MSEPVPFAVALRAELVAAATREVVARQRRQRRRPRLLAAGATVVALCIAALLTVLPHPTPAAADVNVRVRGGEVIVTLEDLEHRPDRIEAAVRAAGLDVSVRAVPVGPSNVGRFVGQESSGSLPPELRPVDGAATSFRGFALPAGWSGSLRLLVGAPAHHHERYAVFSDAFAPGEALACQDLLGRSVAIAAPRLVAQELALRFEVIDGTNTTHLTPSEVLDPRWQGWVVLGADGTGRRSVVVRIGPPPGPTNATPTPPRCRR